MKYMPPRQMGLLTDRTRINRAIHEDDRPCFDFRQSQACRDAIAGKFPNSTSEEERIFHLSERIILLQKQHNDSIHEPNRAIYQVQLSWQMLSEAYAALFAG